MVVSYEKVSPAVLASRIEAQFGCLVSWADIDEDFFEVFVADAPDGFDPSGVAEILAKYL